MQRGPLLHNTAALSIISVKALARWTGTGLSLVYYFYNVNLPGAAHSLGNLCLGERFLSTRKEYLAYFNFSEFQVALLVWPGSGVRENGSRCVSSQPGFAPQLLAFGRSWEFKLNPVKNNSATSEFCRWKLALEGLENLWPNPGQATGDGIWGGQGHLRTRERSLSPTSLAVKQHFNTSVFYSLLE